MLQSLRNRRNRKGFTLAELLIVVAIIAVLVAIAVPLFVGSLNKAQKARDDANIRAVRGAAVVYLLEKSGDKELWPVGSDGKSTVTGWTVDAELSENGEITTLTIAAAEQGTYKTEGAIDTTAGYKVLLYVKPTEISDITNKT